MPDEEIQEQDEQEQPEVDPSLRDDLGDAIDEDGSAEEASAKPEEEGEPRPAPTQEAGASPEEKPDEEPPHHWSAEDQDMFRSLGSKAKAFLLNRSKAMEAAHTQRSQEIAPLRNAVESWTPYLQQVQADPAATFNQLMQHEYVLRTGTNEQKLNLLYKLAQDYGVQLQQEQPKAPSAKEDPFGIQTQIQRAVTPIQQQLQQLGGGVQAQQQAQQQAQAQADLQFVRNFMDEKGADGKLLHPHFREAAQEIEALAQARRLAGQTPDLAQIYEQACWSNPSVRAKLQSAERAKAKAEQARKRRAERATGGLSGGAGGGGREQPGSLRDSLEAAYDASVA